MNAPQLDLFGQTIDALPHRPETFGPASVEYKESRQILTKASGFIGDYDFTLNPYSGCTFGCSYCYAAFFNYDLAKKNTWGEWVTVKENAVALMRKFRRGYLDGKRIYMSSVTDPYQPIESKLNITRDLLEILAYRHTPKLVVQTRGPLVTRDMDIFRCVKDGGGRVQVNMTVTTDDESIRKAFEPLCPSNTQRLKAAMQMNASGIDTCITLTPLLLVNDPKEFIEKLLRTGIRKFIIQQFHFRNGRFVAGTREKALALLAEKLTCDMSQIVLRYDELYREFLGIFKEELKREGLPPPGEGKHGFRPPF